MSCRHDKCVFWAYFRMNDENIFEFDAHRAPTQLKPCYNEPLTVRASTFYFETVMPSKQSTKNRFEIFSSIFLKTYFIKYHMKVAHFPIGIFEINI